MVTGARQTGKSTLVQDLGPGGRRFFLLDDLDVVLHTGNTLEWLAPGVLAAPWWRVL